MKIVKLPNLEANTTYLLSVRGKDANGVYTAWTEFKEFRTKTDSTPPSQPSAPTVFTGSSNSVGPQSVRVRHDGTKQGGGYLENDTFSYEVWVNTSNSNTGGIQVGTIPAVNPRNGGAYSEATFQVNAPSGSTTQYFYVKAVDTSGNRSNPSNTATAASIPFFGDAYISNLSADKITTGTLQANQQISVGTSDPIILKSNSNSPKGQIYIGTGNYGNSNTPFYVDSSGQFSLKDALKFDGTNLEVVGKITASSGDFSGYLTIGGSSGIRLGYGQLKGTATNYKGLYLNSYNYMLIDNSSNPTFQVGSSTGYLQYNGSILSIGGSSPQNISISGNINAYAGSIQGNISLGNSTANLATGADGGSGVVVVGPTAFKIGTTNYTGLGIDNNSSGVASYNYWGVNGTSVKFQVGNATNYMKWTGTSLDIRGDFRTSASEILWTGDITLRGAKSDGTPTTSWVYIDSNDPDITAVNDNGTFNIFHNNGGHMALDYNEIQTGLAGILINRSGGDITLGFNSTSYYTNLAHPDIRMPNLTANSAGVALRMVDNRVYKDSSSMRYKQDITTNLPEFLNPYKVLDLNVVSFKFKPGHLSDNDQNINKDILGLIAEDVYEKYPLAAVVNEDGSIEAWTEKYITVALLKIVQDQQKTITSLESRLAALENK